MDTIFSDPQGDEQMGFDGHSASAQWTVGCPLKAKNLHTVCNSEMSSLMGHSLQ